MKRTLALLLTLAAVVVAGCDPAAPSAAKPARNTSSEAKEKQDDEVVLYCGLDEVHVRPLTRLFERRTGIRVNVKFGNSSALAAELQKQDSESLLADVFWSAEPGPLKSLLSVDDKNRLARLTRDIATRVPSTMRAADARWIGVSARVLVPVQSASRVKPSPNRLAALLTADPPLRIGIRNDAMLPAFLGWLAMRDRAATEKWLAAAGDTILYPTDPKLFAALLQEELDVAIVGQDELARYVASVKLFDAQLKAPVEVVRDFTSPGFVALSCVAAMEGAEHPHGARRLIEFLVSDVAQQYLASSALHSPVVDKVIASPGIVPAKMLERIVKSQASSWADLEVQDEARDALKRD